MVKKIYMLNGYSLVFRSFPFISPPYSLTLSSSYLQRTLTIWDTIVPASLMYILKYAVWGGGVSTQVAYYNMLINYKQKHLQNQYFRWVKLMYRTYILLLIVVGRETNCFSLTGLFFLFFFVLRLKALLYVSSLLNGIHIFLSRICPW